MYFSSHSDVAFVDRAGGLLEVEGKGPLCAEDADVGPFGGKGWADGFTFLKICPGVTAIGAGFLEAFPGMEVLELPRTVEAADESQAAIGFLRKRRVLIRGAFDSFAEAFARRHGLDFLHADIFLACDRDERRQSNTVITLRFFPNGSADVHFDEHSPGSSAGNWGGGVCTSELAQGFYRGCSLEAFAGHFPEHLRESLRQNGELALFLEKVQDRTSAAVPGHRGRRHERLVAEVAGTR